MALPSTIQFVDAISASPTVLLDLNTDAAGGWQVMLDSFDLSPPPLRRATTGTLLSDGEQVSASAYGNRTITMQLRLLYASETQKRAALSALARELDKPLSVLKIQTAGAAGPTFYRVLRSPDYGLRRFLPRKAGNLLACELVLLAEPFGLGLRVDVGATVGPDNANPYFETNVNSWTGINGATLSRTTAQFHEGVASLRITPDGVTAAPRAQSEALTAVPGRYQQVTGWLRSPGATPTVGMTIRWFSDGAGTAFISSAGTLAAIVASTWTSYTVTAFAPSNALSYRIAAEYSGTPTAGQLLDCDELTGRALGTYQVTNDPAAAMQGCFLDVTGVTGDVETPALILLDPGLSSPPPFAAVISTRRRGAPSTDIQVFTQAESVTMGTDTVVQNPITGFSNGQGARTSFATNAGMITRLTTSVPYPTGFPRAGARGTYRVWVALKPSSTSTTYKLRWRVNEFLGGTDLVVSETVTWAPAATSRVLADLGLLQVPIGADPVNAGYGPAPTIQSVALELQMQRSAGSGTMDVDYFAVIPADTEYTRLGRSSVDLTLDGPQDAIYTINDANAGLSSDGIAIPARNGMLPKLTPGSQTNRLYVLRPQNVGAAGITDLDDIANTLIVGVSYWPMFLVAAP